MNKTLYSSKIDWWVPALVVLSLAICFIGPLIDGDDYIIAIAIAIPLLTLEIVVFVSVKYQICGGKLGIRNIFYRWEWFPIDKISEVKTINSALSSSALSIHRIAIKFSDREVLKSTMPLEISPNDRDGFISRLKEINPQIELK